MKQQKCFLYAYCAGVMDADGSIYIAKDTLKSGNINYQLQVKISQKREKVVKAFYGLWGGNINKRITKNGSGNEVEMNTWSISSNKALNLLKKIYPFMRGKKDQVEVAIRFQERKERMKKGKNGRWKKVPDYELKWRKEQYELLKVLKK